MKKGVIVVKAHKYKDWWISEQQVIVFAKTILDDKGYEVINADIKKIEITKHNYKWYVKYQAKRKRG